jgi:hypothetical protein
LQEKSFQDLSENDMHLKRIHVTTEVPHFYLHHGHKALAQTSVENLSNAVESGVPMDFVPNTFPSAAVMDSSGSPLKDFSTNSGLYVKSTERESMATISLHPRLQTLPALERAVFWQEFAHHIWETADKTALAWQQQFALFWEEVVLSEAYKFSNAIEVFRDQKHQEEEMWARAMAYWLAHYFDDTNAEIEWHKRLVKRGWSKLENSSWSKYLGSMLVIEGFQI